MAEALLRPKKEHPDASALLQGFMAVLQRSLIFLFLLFSVPVAAKPRSALMGPTGRIIASIKIESNNVFQTDAPPENKLLYRMANRIHIRTWEMIISRELLFAVGDRYDPSLVAETERNLRALSFIRRARAYATINARGTVDIIIRTYDSWSLAVVADYKRAGSATTMKAGITDQNFLGQGKLASVVGERNGNSDSKSFGYQDPQFFHTRHLIFSANGLTAPGVQNYSLSLNRPFFASIVRWSAGGNASYVKNEIGSTDSTNTTGLVSRKVAEVGANFGVAFATSTEHTRRILFGVTGHDAQYTSIPGQPLVPMPNREHYAVFQLGGEWEELDFLTARRIQKFTRDEDFNLGLSVKPSIGWAPFIRNFDTTESQWLPKLLVRKGLTWPDQLLLFNGGYRSKYVNGANSNRIVSGEATYYIRGLRYQTLAFHTSCDMGWRMDSTSLLSLGEASGLRGYGLNTFTGDRRFLVNFEDRVFVWDNLWRLIDVGTVAFFDAGNVWPVSAPLNVNDLKSSVGIGLRMAASRSSDNTPVRIDLAYALNDNHTSSRWSLSILAGQAF